MSETDQLIITERLELQPFANAHLTGTYVDWLNDKDLMRFSEQRHRQHSLETCKAYVAQAATDQMSLWAMVCTSFTKPRHIGNISLNFDWNNGVADIGLLIGDRDSAGKGFGREAWKAVLQYSLGLRGVRKVTGGCLALNKPMIKIMQSCEMVEDGRRPRHFIVEGSATDLVYFAVYKTGSRDKNPGLEPES